MRTKFFVIFAIFTMVAYSPIIFAAGSGETRDPRQGYTRPSTQTPKKIYPTRTPSSDNPLATSNAPNKSDYNLKFDAGKILQGDGYLNVGLDIPFTDNLVAGPTAGMLVKGTASVKGFQFGATGTYYYNHLRYTTGVIIMSQLDYSTLKINTTPYLNSFALSASGGYQYWVTDKAWEGLNFTIAGGMRYTSLSYPEGSPLRVLSSLSTLLGGSSSVVDSASDFSPVITLLVGWRL